MNFFVLKLYAEIQKVENGIKFSPEKGLIKQNKRCTRCKFKKSIRNNTFFSNLHLSISTILLICWMWCKDFTVKLASEELGLNKSTIIDWYRFCRDILFFHYENDQNSQEKIGGVGSIVEIDESVFSKRKYHRGRYVKELWVFGGVNRTNKDEMFVEIVQDRSNETLLEVIL